MKNYYTVMGLSQDASDKDIKMAYRKLARKYHPDISKEANAEERFKEMGEAYEVLRDKKKRAEYDQYLKQEAAFGAGRTESSGWQGNYESPSFDSDFFETLFGHARAKPRPSKGQDYQGSMRISLEEAFAGTVKSLQIPTDAGGSQTLKVKVPAGIQSGKQIRLAGQGAKGQHGAEAGDIYLTITVDKHPLFDVLEKDIYLTLPITPWEAALGTTLLVPTLSGKIELKIPANSQGGQKLRIKNRGLGNPPGNQYIQLKIVTPTAKTEEDKELYKKMAQLMPLNPRTAMGV
jgi:curved DNA-binding protein